MNVLTLVEFGLGEWNLSTIWELVGSAKKLLGD